MGIVKKQGGISTILIYFGIALGYLNAAVLLPKYFSPEIIGIRTLLIDFANILLQFVLFGFIPVVQRYAPKFRNDAGKMPGLLFIGLFVPSLLFSCFYVASIFLMPYLDGLYIDNSPEFVRYTKLIFPLTFALMLYSIFEVYCKALFKAILPVFLKEILLRIVFLGIVIAYLILKFDIDTFFGLIVLSYYLNVVVIIAYLLKLKKFDIKPNTRLLTPETRKNMLHFAATTFLMGASSFLVTKIDSLMIGKFIGTREVGIYTIAVFIATLIEIPRRGIKQITQPLISEFWNSNNYEELKSICHKTSMAQIAAGSLVFIAITSNIQDIYWLIPNGDNYAGGLWVVLFIALARLVDMSFGGIGDVLLFSDKYKYNLYLTFLFATLAIIGNYYAIPRYGITGAAIASFGAITTICLIRFFMVKGLFSISPFRPSSIVLLAWTSINYFIYNNLINLSFHPLLNIIIKSTVFVMGYLAVIYYFRWIPDLNQLIEQALKKLGLKGK